MTAGETAVQAPAVRKPSSVAAVHKAAYQAIRPDWPWSGRLSSRPARAHLAEGPRDALADKPLARPPLKAMCPRLEVAWEWRSPHVRARHGLNPGLLRRCGARKQVGDEGVAHGLALHRHAHWPLSA